MDTLPQNELFEIGTESVSISVENMLYDIYYRQHGIRRPGQLDNAVFSEIANVVLPKFSIYHYNPESPLLFGPLENNPWYKNDGSMRFIQHVAEFPFEPIGTILRKPGQSQQYVQAYRRKHRALRLLRDFFGVNRQGNMLMIINYCLLNQLWRYRPHRLVNYYKFMNIYQTIVQSMNKLANQSDRQQFLEVRMPRELLTRAQYRMFSREYPKGITNRLIKYFNDDDAWLLFHLWMWVGNYGQYSIFNHIHQKNLGKINLLLTESGKYTVLNLGKLQEWRSSGEVEAEDGYEVDEEEGSGNDENASNRLQVRFYKLLEQLFSFRSGTGTRIIEAPTYTEKELSDTSPIEDDDLPESVQPIQPDDTPTEPEGTKTGKFNPEKAEKLIDEFLTGNKPTDTLPDNDGQSNIAKPSPTAKKLPPLPGMEPEPSSEPEETESSHAGQPSVVKEKQDTVEKVQYVIDEDDHIPTDPTTYTENPKDDYAEKIVEMAKTQVGYGSMTAKEYQRVVKLSQTYKTLPSPYNPTKTIAEDIKVTKEDIQQVNKTKIPDSDWIIDKSMLETSTESMTKDYVENLLPKNIMQSVMSIQNGGVLVTGVERSVVKDVANHYEVLHVDVQPIGTGTSKTRLNIKLPAVDSNGEILVSNSRYFLRKQRRDLPIRKTSPTDVKLTSYYGKLFISKCERRAFNTEKYLINSIQGHILDGFINGVEYENVFDQSIQNVSPIYSMISKRYAKFDYRDNANRTWYCNFDYKHRAELTQGDEALLTKIENQYEGGPYTLFAVDSEQKEYLLFNTRDNTIISTFSTTPTTMESFLNISTEGPLEMVEVEVYSKPIPIGILLAYYIGLTPLCRLLNVTPRKLFRGQHLNLTATEYAIRFGDETWVFDKRNYKAQLILNGFNQYKRYLQDYSAEQFEDKEVYGAILRDAGLPSSIETEFMLMKNMFIDDITKTLLEQMNEPTDFIKLLIRSVELLTTHWSRDEINMEDMMISGYQRIAGHVYSELTRNIKYMHNKVNLQARKRFDLPPNHIFNAIMKDSSMTLVDDINPIHNVKEHDNVTFSGAGGRGRRSMVARTRQYNKTDMGIISEATVDNSDTGATTFLSTDPKMSSLYGTTEQTPVKELGSTNILSVASMLGVGIDTDDQRKIVYQ